MKMRLFVAGLVLAVGGVLAQGMVSNTQALTACEIDSSSSLCRDQNDNQGNAGTKTGAQRVIKNLINILLYIVGVSSVIVIIIAGIRYTISTGNQQALSGAKNMLIGGVLGVAVAAFAFAIVQYVFRMMS